MSGLPVELLVLAGILVAAWGVTIAQSFRTTSVLRRAARYADSLDVVLPDRLRLLVGQRLAHRRRADLFGTAVGTVAAIPLALATPVVTGTVFPASVLILLAAGFGGGAVGSALGSLQRAPFVGHDVVHYARARAVALDDYVSKSERRSIRIIVALPVMVLFVSAALNATGAAAVPTLPPTTFSGALVALAILALVFSEVVGRRIIARAQPTRSDDDLLWDDAMRSIDARGLLSAPALIGVYALLISVTDLGSAVTSPDRSSSAAVILANVGGIAIVVIALVWGISSLIAQPQKYFLRRLWPHYATLTTPAPILRTPNDDSDPPMAGSGR